MSRYFKNKNTILFLIISVSVLNARVHAQTFTLVNTPAITPLTNARAQWADFNNDNLLDLFVSGTEQNGSLQTRIYFSNGDNTFNILDLPALTDMDFALADYNRDGFIDILIQGIDAAFQKHTRIFRNEGGAGFTPQNFLLTPVSKGGVLWHDLDHDTDLDVIVSGLNATLEEVTIAYEWRDGDYFQKDSELIAVSNGKIKSIDVDRDGRAEILLTGLDANGVARSNLYSISDSLQFTLMNNSLPGSAFNNVCVADLNQDSYDDFITTGLTGPALESSTQVFINNTLGEFISINTNIINLSGSSVITGDLDHDGNVDVLLTGHDDGGLNYFRYYRNEGGGGFVETPTTLPGVYNGETTLGDYDSDGDLDIFIIGNSDINFRAAIYLSDQATFIANEPPDAPSSLESLSDASDVTLTWEASQDDHSSSESLSYNVYVSRNAVGTDLVVAPLTALSAGGAKVPGSSNAGHSTVFSLTGLPEGQYYWGVQAIDNAFQGSTFSDQQTFSICHPINIGSDTTVCYKEDISLEAGEELDVVNWYSSGGLVLSNNRTFTFDAETTDTIIAQVIKPFGCFVRDTIVITVVPLPVISLGTDREVCFREELTLDVAEDLDSVNWIGVEESMLQADSHEYTFSVAGQEVIIAQVFSKPFYCVNYDTVTIIPLPLPEISLGTDQEICYGENVQLSFEDQPDLNWKALQANVQLQQSPVFTFEVLQSDTVVVEKEDENGCRGYDTLKVHVLPLPMAEIGNDTAICFNENVLLEFSGSSGQLQWTNRNDQIVSGNTGDFLHHAIVRDTIHVRVIDGNSCINRDSIIVDVLPLPVFSIGRDTALCSNNTILLKTGVGFQRVDWWSIVKGQTILADSWYLNHKVVITDTIVSHVVDSHGCSNYDSMRIQVLSLPPIDLGNDQSICAKNAVRFEILDPFKQVTWSTDGNIELRQGTLLDFVPQESLNIYVRVIDHNDCVNTDTVGISILPLPVFDLGLEKTYCAGDTVSVSTDVGAIHTWTNIDNDVLSYAPACNFIATQTTRLFLTIEDENDCANKDSVDIIVNPLPVLDLFGEEEICFGSVGTFGIKEQPFHSIVWSTTEEIIIASDVWYVEYALLESASIIAVLTDLNGCTSADSLDVSVYPLPTAFAGRDTLLCYGEQTILGTSLAGQPGFSFRWYPSHYLSSYATPTPTATPLESTQYFLTVSDLHGCSGIDSVYVEVNPQVIVDAGEDMEVCIGNPVVLGGNPTASGSQFPYSYEWVSENGSLHGTSANPEVHPDSSAKYYVFVTTGKCEAFIDSISVKVNPLPEIQANPTCSIGSGESVQLHASGGLKYVWSPATLMDDPASPSPIVSPLVDTKYFVQGIDFNGCADTTSVMVFVQNRIFIPSLFTPNGDGSNDWFKLYGSGVEKISLTIFDQSGIELFHSQDREQIFSVGWDGRHNGVILGNDIYVWVIDGQYYNGEPVGFQGQTRGIIKLMK